MELMLKRLITRLLNSALSIFRAFLWRWKKKIKHSKVRPLIQRQAYSPLNTQQKRFPVPAGVFFWTSLHVPYPHKKPALSTKIPVWVAISFKFSLHPTSEAS
jgi:hypothetical protein